MLTWRCCAQNTYNCVVFFNGDFLMDSSSRSVVHKLQWIEDFSARCLLCSSIVR